MPMPPLKSLKGLPVLVVHPADGDGRTLIDHLRRIGCHAEATWPIPREIPANIGVVFLSVDHEHRTEISRLAKSIDGIPPAIIAIVDYEIPSTLELLFDLGALAAMDRPIRPFGVLTNLLLAPRALAGTAGSAKSASTSWSARVSSMQKIQKAKAILMSIHQIGEDAAYETIRQAGHVQAGVDGRHRRLHHHRKRALAFHAEGCLAQFVFSFELADFIGIAGLTVLSARSG